MHTGGFWVLSHVSGAITPPATVLTTGVELVSTCRSSVGIAVRHTGHTGQARAHHITLPLIPLTMHTHTHTLMILLLVGSVTNRLPAASNARPEKAPPVMPATV